ncbi:LuxR C-terminal-related transcriptional regulator [Micromonospora sp. WMMD1128]|uniref:helix-turn-helix transcriptional regulator n=1 Tax=unclassified Micromonospora TaxID=2617518 RepID=UPI00248B3F6E|nr:MULTISPECIES: LuxR C-terminal-related transcriptional regulator [unclassified Micromonospora]WBB73929.1 LuxR C-terminal-related transcriptional regulator [Micromonospora sp. WMMD1128]WFE32671.1 LuxR C-terminal-related transcriptional regulator [Micromonospora sp. WMMD975]
MTQNGAMEAEPKAIEAEGAGWRLATRVIRAARDEVLALIPANCALMSEPDPTRVGWSGAAQVRAVVAGETLLDRSARLKALLGVRADVRSGKHSPTLMVVLDRNLAIVSRGGAASPLAVRSPTAVQALVTIFQHHWSEARADENNLHGRLNPLQRDVLRRLAGGATDDVVARALAVSTRTVQRQVTQIMLMLGARSRLELGIKLAAHGLYERPPLPQAA